MVRCHTNACTCSSILRRARRIERRGRGTSLEEEMREPFGSACFLSHWHSNLRGTQPRRLNGRKPKRKKKKGWHRRLLSWQMMFHLRGFIEPRLSFRFISSLFSAEWPKGLSVSSDESQNAGNGSLLSLVLTNVACDLRDTLGKCSAAEFIVQSALEINQAYSIYPASQCQDPRKGIKCTFFRWQVCCHLLLKTWFSFLFPVIFMVSLCYSVNFVFCRRLSFDILPANNGNLEVFCIHDQRESA